MCNIDTDIIFDIYAYIFSEQYKLIYGIYHNRGLVEVVNVIKISIRPFKIKSFIILESYRGFLVMEVYI